MVPGAILSMGYGFVEYKTKKSALNAIKKLQVFEILRDYGYIYTVPDSFP